MAQVQYPNIDPVFPNGELYEVVRNSDLSEGRGARPVRMKFIKKEVITGY